MNSIPILYIGTVQLVEDIQLGFFDVGGERKDDCGFIVLLNNGNANKAFAAVKEKMNKVTKGLHSRRI